MKKVNLVVVGKLKENYLAMGVEEYLKRLNKYAKINIIELKDLATPDAVKRESDEILAKVTGYKILLDIGGKAISSPEMAEIMDKAYLTSPEITFIIGGSGGVDERVRKISDFRLSFGKVTFPHQLMRLMLLEQIYRAFTIIEGTPYHK